VKRFQGAKSSDVPHTKAVPTAANRVDAPEAELSLTVSVVARRLGVAPATLRTWDRRYGLGPSSHQEGSHRRYMATDLAKLEYMRSLVVAGVPAAEAAKQAHQYEASESVTISMSRSIVGLCSPEEAAEVSTRIPVGGGNVIATPGADQGARGLARAATALDSLACRELITRSISANGVIETWNQLIAPVLRGVGEKWQSSGKGIEIEHVLSSAIESALGAVVLGTNTFVNARPILLVGANNERHQLPLWAMAAALAEQNIRTLMIGAGMPVESLGEAIHKTGPAAAFIWSQIGPTPLVDLESLPVTRPATHLIAGGPGWVGSAGPRVTVINDLPAAVIACQRAVSIL
jgi:MerR family transcriptional regulator, light-induced transcriptional regulator